MGTNNFSEAITTNNSKEINKKIETLLSQEKIAIRSFSYDDNCQNCVFCKECVNLTGKEKNKLICMFHVNKKRPMRFIQITYK